MPLDTSIPLANIGRQPDFLQSMASAAQVADMFDQRSARQQQQQQARAGQMRQQQARQVFQKYSTPEGFDWKRARPEMAGIDPNLTLEYDKFFGEQEKEKLQTEKLLTENKALVEKAQRSKLNDVYTYIGDLDLKSKDFQAQYASRRAIAKMYGMPDEYLPENATPEYLSSLQQTAARARQTTMDDLKSQYLGMQIGGAQLGMQKTQLEIDQEKLKLAKEQREAEEIKAGAQQAVAGNLSLVDQTLNHPGFVSGLNLRRLKEGIPGTPERDFSALIERVKGTLTLENRQKLKGQGQISDRETQMLAESATTLNQDLSPNALKAELLRIKGIFGAAAQRNQQQQPAQPSAPVQPGAPAQPAPQGGGRRPLSEILK